MLLIQSKKLAMTQEFTSGSVVLPRNQAEELFQ
jgi:hypothetical protein